jgi:hypothetical protein
MIRADIRRGDLSYLFIHMEAHGPRGELYPDGQTGLFERLLLGQVYVPEFNGRRHLADRVVAIWHSEFDHSINVAMAGCDEQDLAIIQSMPGVVKESTRLFDHPPETIPPTATTNQKWRIVD